MLGTRLEVVQPALASLESVWEAAKPVSKSKAAMLKIAEEQHSWPDAMACVPSVL